MNEQSQEAIEPKVAALMNSLEEARAAYDGEKIAMIEKELSALKGEVSYGIKSPNALSPEKNAVFADQKYSVAPSPSSPEEEKEKIINNARSLSEFASALSSLGKTIQSTNGEYIYISDIGYDMRSYYQSYMEIKAQGGNPPTEEDVAKALAGVPRKYGVRSKAKQLFLDDIAKTFGNHK